MRAEAHEYTLVIDGSNFAKLAHLWDIATSCSDDFGNLVRLLYAWALSFEGSLGAGATELLLLLARKLIWIIHVRILKFLLHLLLISLQFTLYEFIVELGTSRYRQAWEFMSICWNSGLRALVPPPILGQYPSVVHILSLGGISCLLQFLVIFSEELECFHQLRVKLLILLLSTLFQIL